MRMKDIIGRTGLTDRAVRLYIEEGLLSPSTESDYTGRRSFDFSEEDVRHLETIAVLRRAGFSIADIREMQTSPDCCPTLLDAHRQALTEEIGQKQEILDILSAIPVDTVLTADKIADCIRTPTSSQIIPKEDSAMLPSDFKTVLRRRIPAMLSLIFYILSAIHMVSLSIQCAFGTVSIQRGGGYLYNYVFSVNAAAKHSLALVIPLMLVAAAVCTIVHLFGGHRMLPIAALILGSTAITALLLLPAQSKDAMFLFEFHNYRFSVMHKIFYYAEGWFDVFLKTLKFVPILLASVCTVIGICTEKDNDTPIHT